MKPAYVLGIFMVCLTITNKTGGNGEGVWYPSVMDPWTDIECPLIVLSLWLMAVFTIPTLIPIAYFSVGLFLKDFIIPTRVMMTQPCMDETVTVTETETLTFTTTTTTVITQIETETICRIDCNPVSATYYVPVLPRYPFAESHFLSEDETDE